MYMEEVAWQPTASMTNLLQRATIMQKIRDFFLGRGVVEVETPMMSHACVTDVHLRVFKTDFLEPGATDGNTLYFITSPEFHMKRLLAVGSGPIYQLGRCFRNEEVGRYHNPEFTLLEWYRPGFNMYQLMNEVDSLLCAILETDEAERFTYDGLFKQFLAISPLEATLDELKQIAKRCDLGNIAEQEEDYDALVQLLFTTQIETQIGKERPAMVYHFPAAQASLAKISEEDNRVADRFEVYFQGVELANGFGELTDAVEQQTRFEKENQQRRSRNLPEAEIDKHFLAALQAGIPECSGVALGVDRLMMIALKADSLSEVIAFPTSIA